LLGGCLLSGKNKMLLPLFLGGGGGLSSFSPISMGIIKSVILLKKLLKLQEIIKTAAIFYKQISYSDYHWNGKNNCQTN